MDKSVAVGPQGRIATVVSKHSQSDDVDPARS